MHGTYIAAQVAAPKYRAISKPACQGSVQADACKLTAWTDKRSQLRSRQQQVSIPCLHEQNIVPRSTRPKLEQNHDLNTTAQSCLARFVQASPSSPSKLSTTERNSP